VTGPEHYAEAEKLLAAQTAPAVVPGYGPVLREDADMDAVAAAQVHATLALAAATALNDGSYGSEKKDYDAWKKAAGVKGGPS
jgi:hypothetical protein